MHLFILKCGPNLVILCFSGCQQIESFILDQDSFGSDTSALASKLALLAATGQASLSDGGSEDPISVDAETQARLEALLEAAGKMAVSDFVCVRFKGDHNYLWGKY